MCNDLHIFEVQKVIHMAFGIHWLPLALISTISHFCYPDMKPDISDQR